MQILVKLCSSLILEYIYKYHTDDPLKGLDKILDFYDLITSLFLGSGGDIPQKDLFLVRAYLEKQKENYSLWLERIKGSRRKGLFLEWEESLALKELRPLKDFISMAISYLKAFKSLLLLFS